MDAKYYKAKVANLKKQAIEMVKVELSIESIFCTLDFGYIILSELSCWSSTRKELEMGSKIMDTSLFAVCFHQPRPWVHERFPQPQHLHGHAFRSCFIIVRDQMAGARVLGDL